jgi:hypothetical protein
LVAVLAVALACLAAPARAETTLRVRAGFDGFGRPGELIPVRVRVQADRLVDGRLDAVASGGPVSMLDIEVPGGSVKEFLVPVVLGQGGEWEINVDLSEGETTGSARRRTSPSVRAKAVVRRGADTELVGLLPGVLGSRSPPGTAPLAVDSGTARFIAVEPDLLARPELLRALGTIGLAADDLTRLPPGGRDGLLRWAAEGGRLLVDAEPGAAFASLPEAWRPRDAGPVAAGLGEIRATSGAMAAGRWAGLVEPTIRGTTDDTPPVYGGWTSTGLLSDLGTRTLSIGALIGPLVVYALVAGPLLYLVLHRRRRELLVWVLLPVLAVIITAGSYAGAVFSRGSTRAAHMSLVTFRPEAADAVTSTAVTSPGGGEVTITFPDGWRAVPSTSDWDGSTDPTSNAVLDAGGATGRLRLDPAGIGITAASGGIRAGDGLVVSARSDGSSVTGTVRNATPYDLSGAAVLVGKDHTAIGDLPAGEERPWRLAGEPQRAHFTLPGPDLWPLISQVQDVNHDLWRQAGSRFGPDFLRPGDAVAVGWTRGWRPAVSVSGAAGRPDGRSLLIARTPVVHASGGVPAQAITRQIVRGGMPVDPEPGTDQSMSPDPMVLRFVLPTGGNGGGLVFKAPENLLRLEVWQDGGWQELFAAPGAQAQTQGGITVYPPPQSFGYSMGPGGQQYFYGQGAPSGPEVAMQDHTVPPGARSGRIVYLRVTQDPAPGLHTAWGYTLREQA